MTVSAANRHGDVRVDHMAARPVFAAIAAGGEIFWGSFASVLPNVPAEPLFSFDSAPQ